MSELKCIKHNIDKICLGGSSAHETNWYCPVCDKEPKVKEFDHCPFCKSPDVEQDYGSSFVICNGCKAAAKAELWNTRTPSIEDIVAAVEACFNIENFNDKERLILNTAIAAIRAMDK